ncbi:MAG: hypothetical protein KDB02_10320 [Acidimicrobiales bacterium]|nr:hypothetical protein [Acidimicrobiales bacterium]
MLLVAEVALCAVHLSVVVGFSRLYRGWSFAPDLVLAVVAAHVIASICRRRLPAPVAALAAVAGLALVLTWTIFPHTTSFGLPGSETWDALTAALSDARTTLREVVAPTEPTVGFQAASMIALWASVWFADWGAFRLRATIEPVAPAAVIFVFVTVLGSGAHRISSATAFAVTVLCFLAANRALRARLDHTWLSDTPERGPALLLRAGLAAAAVAVLAGTVVGPRLPGTDGDPVLNWRDRGGGGTSDRTTVSPIVDLRRRLVDQSDQIFFTVRADRPAYWRLTGLDEFDGRIWKIDEQFGVADGRLADDGPNAPGERLRQSFHIDTLDDLWVPVAFQARNLLTSSEDLRWDPDTSTLIVDRASAGTAGMSYTIESVTPTFSAAQLRADDYPVPASMKELLSLPATFPRSVADTARRVTGDTSNPYERVIALQRWFRSNFTYSVDVPSGHSDDALVEFLEDRRGYCEQFAGAFAAMARSLGIPARVAVGFTPGDVDSVTGRFQVRGRHAHAWPEIWFPTYGWVPFEPTPGRGMPGAESYTGVAPAQDETPARTTTPSTTTTTDVRSTTTTVTDSPTTTRPRDETVSIDPLPDTPDRSGPRWPLVLGLGAVLMIAWPIAMASIRLLRSRDRRGGSAGEILHTWSRVVTALRRSSGLRPDPSETHAVFAGRGGVAVPEMSAELIELGELVGRAAWSPTSLVPGDVRRASVLGDSIKQLLDRRRSVRQRLRQSFSLREALDGR